MEIHGAAYLYALAAIGMAFLAFTTIVVIIRQSVGSGLSKFQLLITQVLIEHGFVVVVFSLLPLLLALTDITHHLIWRISSGIAAATIACHHIDYAFRRYPAVRSHPHPKFALFNFAITGIAVLGLVGNAVGFPFKPQAATYAGVMTWMLCEGADIFLLSLPVFLREQKETKRKRPPRKK